MDDGVLAQRLENLGGLLFEESLFASVLADEADALEQRFNTVLTVPAPGVLANDADNGGGAMTATLVTSTTHGTVSLSGDGFFTFAPNPGFVGPDIFSYRAVNTIGSSNTATVTITVPPPPPPTSVDDAFTTPFATALRIDAPGVLGNDTTTAGASLRASLVNNVASGGLALAADGGFLYTPNPDFFGTDRFTYRASNVGGTGNVATVTITVSNTTTLQPPGALYAASIVDNVVTLRFRAPYAGPAPASYVLKGGVLPGQVLASLPTGSAFPIFTLTAPTGAFHVRMHSVDDGGGESAPSHEIQIFVGVPAALSVPADLTGLVNGSSVALAWRNTYGGGTPANTLLDVSGSIATTIPMGPGEVVVVGGVPPGTYTLRVRSGGPGDTVSPGPAQVRRNREARLGCDMPGSRSRMGRVSRVAASSARRQEARPSSRRTIAIVCVRTLRSRATEGIAMAITASDLRQDIYRILDAVLDSGQPIEVERRGRRLKIAPVAPASKLSRLVPRTKFLRGDPDDIISIDWSDTWRP